MTDVRHVSYDRLEWYQVTYPCMLIPVCPHLVTAPATTVCHCCTPARHTKKRGKRSPYLLRRVPSPTYLPWPCRNMPNGSPATPTAAPCSTARIPTMEKTYTFAGLPGQLSVTRPKARWKPSVSLHYCLCASHSSNTETSGPWHWTRPMRILGARVYRPSFAVLPTVAVCDAKVVAMIKR